MPGYPVSNYGTNPILGLLGGLVKGGIQSVINYGQDPRGGGGIGTILGGAFNGYQDAKLRQAQVAEVARQEQRTSMDAALKYSQATGIPLDQVLQQAGGIQYTKYDPTVSQSAGQARGNNAVARSLRVNTGGDALGYADPALVNKVLGTVQQQRQDQASNEVLPGNVAGGYGDAGNPVQGMQPLPSTFSMVPQAQAVLGLTPGGQFTQLQPQMTMTPPAPQAPSLQPPMPRMVDASAAPAPQGPVANLNGTLNPGGITDWQGNPIPQGPAPVQGGITMTGNAPPPEVLGMRPQSPQDTGEDLYSIARSTPNPETQIKGYQAGSAVAGKLNDQRVTLYDQQQSELGNREQAALQGANAKDRTDAYRQSSEQIRNVVDLLHRGSPQEQEVAKQNLLKSGAGGGHVLTPKQQRDIMSDDIDNARYAKPGTSERQKIINDAQVLIENGADKAQVQAILDQLPQYGKPLPPGPRTSTPQASAVPSRGLRTGSLKERLKGTLFDR
jgi:hypothetical protein